MDVAGIINRCSPHFARIPLASVRLGSPADGLLARTEREKEVALVPTHTPNQLWTVSADTHRPGADAPGCDATTTGEQWSTDC
jgi:hypothetical protein